MDAQTNALLIGGDQPLSLPAFDRIRAEDFEPALSRAMALHRDEIAALVSQRAAPDFDNTVAAFDRSGALLQRIESIFHNLASSATHPALQLAQRALAAPLSAHWSAVLQDAGFGDAILHRTGHSLGENVHGNGAHLDDYETHDERRLLPGSGFTIEPGLYFKDFGVRTEINMVWTGAGPEVTGPRQASIVTLV